MTTAEARLTGAHPSCLPTGSNGSLCVCWGDVLCSLHHPALTSA